MANELVRTCCCESLSTQLDDTQFSVSDNGQRFLHPRAHEARYILVIVDVYSQRVYLHGLYGKDKTVDAFAHQVYVQTDEGTEFFKKELLKLFRDNDVTLYTMKMNHGHAFLAEEKIRELKKKLTKMKGRQPTMNIAAALQIVQNNMNASLIRYFGLSPQQIEREYADVTDETMRNLFVGDKITKQSDRQRRYHVQKDKVKKRH